MSRICVKKFPKYVTEKRLRHVFSKIGEITDMKLPSRLDGTSRELAFIGFPTEHEAQEAINYFNKSFIDTRQIVVEIAKAPLRSCHSLKKLGKVNGNTVKSSAEIAKRDKQIKKKPEADDPQLQEFLEPKSEIWSSGMRIAPTTEETGKENVFSVKKANEPVFSNGANKSKKTKKNKDVETERVDKDVDGNAMEVEAADIDDVLHTGRLFVLNLPYSATEEEIAKHFSKFGEVSEVHLVLDKVTKRPKGIAYILYRVPESAARAMEELDNPVFQGRLLKVLPAKPRETSDKQINDTCNLPKTYKQRKEEQRKASEARGNTKAWNSFLMRNDTILENIARMYGVKKSEILDRESEDPAVRLALGETKVIMETKKALAKAGVNVTSLEKFARGEGNEKNRSKHILVVKHLPFAATEKELAQMFGKFGSIDKIILPPTKGLALVVFLEPAEARAAMTGIVHWAPGDILEPKVIPDNNEKKNDVGENDVRRVNLEHKVEIDSDITESNVLHVKNLSFKTTDDNLKKHLTELMKQGKILSVKIIKHGRNLSSGYGFVEFDSIETATSVYRDLQGTVVDGHALILRFCEDKGSDRVGKGSGKDKTLKKLHVKNVAFQATVKELRQLCSSYGKIKSLRIPNKNIGKPAGYAFIEFMTNQEALNAKEELSSTHLYGRRLVLEWAKDDDSMKTNRARSVAKYMDQENYNPKKRKSSTVVDERRIKFKKNN